MAGRTKWRMLSTSEADGEGSMVVVGDDGDDCHSCRDAAWRLVRAKQMIVHAWWSPNRPEGQRARACAFNGEGLRGHSVDIDPWESPRHQTVDPSSGVAGPLTAAGAAIPVQKPAIVHVTAASSVNISITPEHH